jgi:hypothetical protein
VVIDDLGAIMTEYGCENSLECEEIDRIVALFDSES